VADPALPGPLTARDPAATVGPLAQRETDLRRLADEPWDLLVVGGGITGAGALLDAVTRGLKVALVEQEDWASGTSSRSSRLIHGGLRYLQQGRVGLVREALAERARLLRLAPHLVRLETFLFPLYGRPGIARAFYTMGMAGYDLLGSARSAGRHRHLDIAGSLDWAPQLRLDGLRGGILYHDAVEDDARLVLAVVRSAQARGGLAMTRVAASGGLWDGGRLVGATVRDTITGAGFEVRATTVLDATGVWGALPARPFARPDVTGNTAAFSVLPSRGSHILVPRERIPVQGGMTLRIPGHVGFMVPWPRHWVIGTTDDPYHGPLDHPSAAASDVDRILQTVNGVLDVGLARDDIVGTYAGLRPLVAPPDATTSVTISREHRVAVEAPGLVRISGGKYTTYRVMASDAIDAVLGDAARSRPSVTAEVPLVGAAPRAELEALAARLAREADLDAGVADSLVERHGTEAPAVLELGRSLGLVRPLADAHPYLEAEIAWAVLREGALTLDDLLARRIRLVHVLRDRGRSVAPRAAAIAGAILGWSGRDQELAVATFLAAAHREFDVPPVG
jgi:glycerol-3-phosphate dehydrogenase